MPNWTVINDCRMFNKSKSKRNFRKRRIEVNEEEPENSQVYEVENGLELAKLKRELKKRTAGVNSESLAKGVKTPRFDDPNDPYKLNSGGGLTQIREKRLGNNEKDVTQISSTFKTEKKIRDEEEEMNKFIESEILKRRGIESATKESMKQNLRLEDIVDPKVIYLFESIVLTDKKRLKIISILFFCPILFLSFCTKSPKNIAQPQNICEKMAFFPLKCFPEFQKLILVLTISCRISSELRLLRDY